VPLLAVTVLGDDRPGIVAEATGLLAAVGGNLEDSTMTLLRGAFAMVLLVDASAAAEDVGAALAPLESDGSLSVSVREVSAHDEGVRGAAYLLSVHGGDRTGIVSAVTGELARVGGNITDLSTRLTGDLYVLLAEVDLPDGTDVAALETDLRRVARELGVDVSLRPVDVDVL
jgi:glycine cleavage system transcriptional repressor